MSSRRQKRSNARVEPSARGNRRSEICSSEHVDFSSLDRQRIEGVYYGTESSDDLKAAIVKARYFSRRNLFIRAVNKTRLAFLNAGFCLVPAEGANKKTRAALADWMKKNRSRHEMVCKYVRDAWREWMTSSNVVSFWRVDSARPTLLNPEDVTFKDTLGSERLKFRLNITDKQIDDMDWSPAVKARLKESKTIDIGHDDDLFFFKVLKDDKVGTGFAWPDLMPVLLALGQQESLEAGDNILANASRLILELHKMGHEIKSGMLAGSARNFIKKERAEAVQKELKGKVGHVRMAVNFDHAVDWPRPDPKHFEGKKYASIVDRLIWWSLPIGHMITARALNPHLMDTLRTQVLDARAEMAMHLDEVINEVFGAGEGGLPFRVSMKWDHRCLSDSRLLFEMIKNGLNAGPVSQTTYLRSAGLSEEEEREHKQDEADLPKDQTHPLYDAAHGPPKPNGKPPGKNDKA
jgi:hypothetical protein